MADGIRELESMGGDHAKQVLLDAADSLVDRYSEGVRCFEFRVSCYLC